MSLVNKVPERRLDKVADYINARVGVTACSGADGIREPWAGSSV